MQAHFGKEKALQIAVGPILVVLVVPSSDVSHITIQDGVVKLFTLKGETHLLALTLDQAEKELDPQRFMRVNRQFILDNQWAFKYGAQQGFGMRDDRFEEGEEVIARKKIEDSIDGEKAETSRIVLVGRECFYLEQPLEISTSLSFRSGGPHSTRGGRGSPGTSRGKGCGIIGLNPRKEKVQALFNEYGISFLKRGSEHIEEFRQERTFIKPESLVQRCG